MIGCVALLWDHMLTLRGEIEYIWKLPIGFSKLAFLFNRYFVEASLCFSVYSEFEDLLNVRMILLWDYSTTGIAWPAIPRGKPAYYFPRKISNILTPSYRCGSSGHVGYHVPLRPCQVSLLCICQCGCFGPPSRGCKLCVSRRNLVLATKPGELQWW